jgi:tetratricopeptide (TPR) repeat protein
VKKKAAQKSTSLFSRIKQAFSRSQKKQTTQVSEQAVSDLEELVRSNPGNYRLRLKLADQYNLLGKHDQAISEYLTSARLYAENDFIPLAIATYKKILNEEPDHLEANLELANIYKQKNFFADATIHFHRIFEIYRQENLTTQALETLETLIAIAPDKEPFRQLFRELFPEHRENSISIYSDIIVPHEKTPDHHHNQQHSQPNQEATGDSFFDLGAELGGDLVGISSNDIDLSGSHESLEKTAEHGVEEIFETMKSTFQEESGDTADQEKFHYNLALAYYELNLPEQALKESEEVVNSTSFRLSALLLRSRIFVQLGSLSAALSQVQQGLLEKGLTRQDYLSLKLQLGLILKAMGHHTQALEAFHEAYALAPDNPEIFREIQTLEHSGGEIIRT